MLSQYGQHSPLQIMSSPANPANPDVYAMTYKLKVKVDMELEKIGKEGPGGIPNRDGLTYADFMMAVNACKAEKKQDTKVSIIRALFEASDKR